MARKKAENVVEKTQEIVTLKVVEKPPLVRVDLTNDQQQIVFGLALEQTFVLNSITQLLVESVRYKGVTEEHLNKVLIQYTELTKHPGSVIVSNIFSQLQDRGIVPRNEAQNEHEAN